MTLPSAIAGVRGRAVVLRGNDIDTDRIMPARFLKAITFEGLEQHLFADDRAALTAAGDRHPLDDPRAGGASILLTDANFGCGSSREHAPQALRRWGFGAIVAQSFSPIFSGNALAIGLVCVTVPAEVMVSLVRAAPESELIIDLRASTVTIDGIGVWPVSLPEAQRHALLSGEWDATSLLLANYEEVERVDARVPTPRTTPRNA